MARFCNQCGRPLQEGEVCTCSQQRATNQNAQMNMNQNAQMNMNPNMQMNMNQNVQMNMNQNVQMNMNQNAQMNAMGNRIGEDLKQIFSNFVPMLKDPVKTIENMAATGTTALGWEMIIMNLIVTLLMSIIMLVNVRIKLGDYAQYLQLPYVKIIIMMLVIVAATYAVMAGLLCLSAKAFFKAEVEFKQILAIIGAKALLDACVLLIVAILGLLSGVAAAIVAVLGNIYTMLVMIVSFCKIVFMDESKKIYALLITYVGLALVHYVLYTCIIGSVLGGSLSTIMSYL